MNEFANVSVIKKANIYSDGKVTSRTVVFEDGRKKTLGIMLPGVYEFGTEKKEIMEIISGKMEALISGESHWIVAGEGDSFTVPPDTKFKVKATVITDYCCSYGE